jgi:hypothetical protein
MARIYLAAVALLYLILAAWCSWAPAAVSEKVGLRLKPGAGQSEFLTVYGGLELGLALAFAIPIFRPDATQSFLLACVLFHGSLVVYRSAAFLLYTGFTSTTYSLACGEWLLFVSSLIIYSIASRTTA